MLKHLAISHYAIVDQLEVDCARGMTVITGETGAGKSIMLDALGLCLGDRADSKAVQPGAQRAEISAEFDISDIGAARDWLAARDLDQDGECILRRTISADGRSRAFINGSPSTLADCAELGALLVDIHSQHAHQSLLRRTVQRQLLDAYAGVTDLSARVADLADQWRNLKAQHDKLTNQTDADRARRDLLTYQVSELDQLALEAGEIERLEAAQKELANASFIIESAGRVAEACETQADQLRGLRGAIDDDRHPEREVANARELLASVEIQLDEVHHELRRYAESVDTDPQRLDEVERRLEAIYDLARKHRVLPEQLQDHHQQLAEELAAIDGDDARVTQLEQSLADAASHWQKAANKLTSARKKAGKKLASKTMAILAQLAMDRCQLTVDLAPSDAKTPQSHGAESVELLISTNPGAAPGSLGKVASGGELSRISLALQVAAAEVATSPTMVFDEVDVGIGGGTAEVVGELLRQLAKRVQVVCVTHQPQVAAKGEQHLQVHKAGDAKQVSTGLVALNKEGRVAEVARMLGGLKITESTRNHAREMLEGA